MANEIKLNLRMQLENGSVKEDANPGLIQVTQTAARRYADTQNIGTSEEALAVGSISTVGYIYARNLDATNFVELGIDDSGFKSVIKLKATEAAVWRSSTNAPYAKADTAAVELDYVIFED